MLPIKSELSPVSDACRIEGQNVGYTTGAWPAANKALYLPFFLPYPITVKKIGWRNSTTVNGNIDVGVYDHFGNSKVLLGAVAMTGSGLVQIGDVADTNLLPGYYYLGMSSSSGTATFSRVLPSTLVMRTIGMQEEAAAHPLPATATPIPITVSYVPVVWLAMVAAA